MRELMEQPTRMFRTLGSLAVAMTVSAVWLGWIDPSAPLSADPPAFESVLDQVRSLVVEGTPVHKNMWQAVEIVAEPSDRVSGSLLAARADRGRSHFRIDIYGAVSSTPRWRNQEQLSDLAVIVSVAQSDRHSEMSRAQFDGLRGLLIALRDSASMQTAETVQELPVRVQADWARVYGLEPGTIVEIPTRNTVVG
jgi:hypothetical protein